MKNTTIEEYRVRDAVVGTVTGGCSSGVFVELENGESAFAHFCGLETGTKVFCSILRKATEKWLILVSIDSVMEGGFVAA